MKQYGLSLVLALAAALLAALAWLWITPQGGLRNVTWQPPAPLTPELGEQTPKLPAAEPMDTGMFIATLDRPLFSPSRRPAPKVVETAKVEEVDPFAGIHLYGLYTAGEGASPGILARIDGKVRRVAAGEALGAWKLKSVQDRQVIFVRDGQERTLDLAIARPGVPAPAAARPLAPGAPAATGAPASATDAQAQREAERRERLRLRNEARAKAGAPPIVE